MCRRWLEQHIKEQQKHNQPLPSNFSFDPENRYNRSICKKKQLYYKYHQLSIIIRKTLMLSNIGHKSHVENWGY